jgi:hypothetical protein
MVLLPSVFIRTGRLPRLHYIDERPDRKSTNRARNFASSAVQNYAFRLVIARSTSSFDKRLFLLQLPNPLLQELPLWFQLGQGRAL